MGYTATKGKGMSDKAAKRHYAKTGKHDVRSKGGGQSERYTRSIGETPKSAGGRGGSSNGDATFEQLKEQATYPTDGAGERTLRTRSAMPGRDSAQGFQFPSRGSKTVATPDMLTARKRIEIGEERKSMTHTRATVAGIHESSLRRVGQGGAREAQQYSDTREQYERAVSGKDRLSKTEIRELGRKMTAEYKAYEEAKGRAPDIGLTPAEKTATWAYKSHALADWVRGLEMPTGEFDPEDATSGTQSRYHDIGSFAPDIRDQPKGKGLLGYGKEAIAQNIEMFGSAPTTIKAVGRFAVRDPGIIPALAITSLSGMVRGAKEDPLQTIATMAVTAGVSKGIHATGVKVSKAAPVKMPGAIPDFMSVLKTPKARGQVPAKLGKPQTPQMQFAKGAATDPQTVFGGSTVTAKVAKASARKAAYETEIAGMRSRAIAEYGIKTKPAPTTSKMLREFDTPDVLRAEVVAKGLKEHGKVMPPKTRRAISEFDAPESIRSKVVSEGLKQFEFEHAVGAADILKSFTETKLTPREQIVSSGIKAHGKVLTPEQIRIGEMSAIERMVGIEAPIPVYGEAIIRQATRRPQYTPSRLPAVILSTWGKPLLQKAAKVTTKRKPVKVVERVESPVLESMLKTKPEAKPSTAWDLGLSKHGQRVVDTYGATKPRGGVRTRPASSPFVGITPAIYTEPFTAPTEYDVFETGDRTREFGLTAPVGVSARKLTPIPTPTPTRVFGDAFGDAFETEPLTRTVTRTKTKTAKAPTTPPPSRTYPETPLPIAPTMVTIPLITGDKHKQKIRPKKKRRYGARFEQIVNPIKSVEDYMR